MWLNPTKYIFWQHQIHNMEKLATARNTAESVSFRYEQNTCAHSFLCSAKSSISSSKLCFFAMLGRRSHSTPRLKTSQARWVAQQSYTVLSFFTSGHILHIITYRTFLGMISLERLLTKKRLVICKQGQIEMDPPWMPRAHCTLKHQKTIS